MEMHPGLNLGVDTSMATCMVAMSPRCGRCAWEVHMAGEGKGVRLGTCVCMQGTVFARLLCKVKKFKGRLQSNKSPQDYGLQSRKIPMPAPAPASFADELGAQSRPTVFSHVSEYYMLGWPGPVASVHLWTSL